MLTMSASKQQDASYVFDYVIMFIPWLIQLALYFPQDSSTYLTADDVMAAERASSCVPTAEWCLPCSERLPLI